MRLGIRLGAALAWGWAWRDVGCEGARQLVRKCAGRGGHDRAGREGHALTYEWSSLTLGRAARAGCGYLDCGRHSDGIL